MIITHNIRARVLAFLALALTCAGLTHGQSIEVTASIDPPQIYAGTTAVLQISIVGVDPSAAPTAPPPPVVPGLTIAYAGISTIPAPVVIVNGRRQDTGPDKIILQYSVTPAAPGRYTIPAIPVTFGSRTIATSPLVLRAIEPPVATDVAIVVEADTDTVFEGQPVTVVVTVYFLNVRSASFAASIPSGFELYPSVSPAEASAENIVNLELNGKPVRAAVGRAVREGKQWRTVSIAYTLIPRTSGALEIPGSTAILDVITGERNRAMGLISEPVIERRVARAEPLTLTVKPLPTEGRPADFTGLVGSFDIRTKAAVTEVDIGEPIPFTVSIAGPRPMELVDPPDLRAMPEFTSAFKLSPEGWSEPSTAGSTGPPRIRDFTTTIRATSDAVTEIPSVSFSYFDPERAAYRIASSKPIPLNVRQTRQITAADAIGGPVGAGGNGYALPRVERVPLDAGPKGPIFAPLPARLTSQHLLLTDQLRSPIIAAAVALPPLALSVTAILAVRRRSHDPALARSRRALRDALARLGSSPTADRIADAVRALLASRFDLDPHTITAHDARRLIGPTDPALAADAARVLLAADAPRFADGGAHSPGATLDDPRTLLTRLDKATAP